VVTRLAENVVSACFLKQRRISCCSSRVPKVAKTDGIRLVFSTFQVHIFQNCEVGNSRAPATKQPEVWQTVQSPGHGGEDGHCVVRRSADIFCGYTQNRVRFHFHKKSKESDLLHPRESERPDHSRDIASGGTWRDQNCLACFRDACALPPVHSAVDQDSCGTTAVPNSATMGCSPSRILSGGVLNQPTNERERRIMPTNMPVNTKAGTRT